MLQSNETVVSIMRDVAHATEFDSYQYTNYGMRLIESVTECIKYVEFCRQHAPQFIPSDFSIENGNRLLRQLNETIDSSPDRWFVEYQQTIVDKILYILTRDEQVESKREVYTHVN